MNNMKYITTEQIISIHKYTTSKTISQIGISIILTSGGNTSMY